MYNNFKTKKNSTNDLISKMLETFPKSKKSVEQQDNESLNTMDYYKEESASKNNLIDENKYLSKKLKKQSLVINSRAITQNPNLQKTNINTYDNNNLGGLYKEISFAKTKSFYLNNNGKNVQKRFEDMKINNDYCSRCNSEIEYSTKICRFCFNPICRKCLKDIFNRNLDNNEDRDNFDQNLVNKRKCPNCRHLTAINDYVVIKRNIKDDSGKTYITYTEPSDSPINEDSISIENRDEKGESIFKELDDKYMEYDLLLKQIEEKKKELEIKKNLNMNIIQILQRTVEYEYNFNVNKLEEISMKIKNLQNFIIKQKNNSKTNFNDTSNLQNIFLKYKKSMNIFLKNLEKINQKISLKSKPKSFQNYESNTLSINLSETYYMKKKEIFSNDNIGKAFIKVDRFVNNYLNCLNFSVSIQQDDKHIHNSANDNIANKSKFVVHLVINNKLIKLTKDNKDNNKSCLNYDGSLEESQVFNSKNQKSDINNNKNEKFDVKLIITELFL